GNTVPYILSNIFPRDLPFYVAAFFFEDETIDLTNTAAPQLGDIFSDLPFREIPAVEVRTGGIHTLNIGLTEPIFYDPDE
ncbi:MAG: hypothetical protein VX519_10870, partial [Myxococcota bacterium]|nr:hypothetical protein [Myxococcota bacterium]